MIIGIDPGIKGAFAVLDDNGDFMHVYDMPTMNRNKSDDKQQINCAELLRLLRECYAEGNTRVIIERVMGMPSIPGKGGVRRNMGSASGFIFGRTVGHIECAVISLGCPVEFVMAGEWKKAFKLGKSKEHSRAYAQQLYPSAPLGLKKHADRAEAILLARWYAQKESPQLVPQVRRKLVRRSST